MRKILKVDWNALDVLDSNRDADQVGRDSASELLFGRQLLMRRRSGVDDERLGISDVGQVGREHEAVDDEAAALAVLGVALDAKREDGAVAVLLERLERLLVVRVRRKAGIRDPLDGRVRFKPLGEREGVLRVSLDAKAEGFDCGGAALVRLSRQRPNNLRPWRRRNALKGERQAPRSRRTSTRTLTAKVRLPKVSALWASVVSVSLRDQRGRHSQLEAVVAFAGLVKVGVALRLSPVKTAGVDNDARDAVPVTANPLRRRVDDDVGAVVKGPSDCASGTECVVHDEHDAILVRDLGDRSDVGNVVLGVSDRLDIDRLRLVVDILGKIGRVIAVDEADLDAKALEEDLELVVRPPVQTRGRDDVVASLGERSDRLELRGLPARRGDGRHTALKRRDALLKDLDSGLCETQDGSGHARAASKSRSDSRFRRGCRGCRKLQGITLVC